MTKPRNILPIGYYIEMADEKSWSEFLRVIQRRHKLGLPFKDRFGFWSKGFPNSRFADLHEKFRDGDFLAAWRAIRVAHIFRLSPPSWATEHFSTALEDFLLTSTTTYLTGGSRNPKGGGDSGLAEHYRNDYGRACKYAALLVADYHSHKGGARVNEATKILNRQGIFHGTSYDRMTRLWTKLRQEKDFASVPVDEFLELLHHARYLYDRIITEKSS